MAAFDPLNYDDTRQSDVVKVYSDALDNIQAIREIDEWARTHGYVRSRESILNVQQTADGKRYYYSACYRLTEDDLRAAEEDLRRIRERREKMPVTTSSDVLLREED